MGFFPLSFFPALKLKLKFPRRNIPFSITSGIRFFEQAHVKDVTAYLKLASNSRDELSFKRLAQLLPGIGGKAADKLWKTFGERVQSPESKVQSPDPEKSPERSPLARALQGCAAGVPKKAAVAWAQFVATMAQLEGEVRGYASRMIRLVIV